MTKTPLILTSSRLNAGGDEAEPRVDFLEIACALNGTLSYPAVGGGFFARVEEKTASDWRQAWAARRHPASAYLSLSEKVGLPLALLPGRRVPHILLAHHLTSARKRAMQVRLGYLHRFDRIIVLCAAQAEYLRREAGVPEERIRLMMDKVDHRFFMPQGAEPSGYILSVGRERRDYETLMTAVEPLGIPTVIVASSPWSRQGHEQGGKIPSNVTLKRGLSFLELRALYDAAALVVVPLQKGTDYAAGVNGVLEAMAMRKPLIVSQTPGLSDYIDEGETALFAPAADPDALRAVIERLWADQALGARLSVNARKVVEAGRNLDAYVATVAGIVREVASE